MEAANADSRRPGACLRADVLSQQQPPDTWRVQRQRGVGLAALGLRHTASRVLRRVDRNGVDESGLTQENGLTG